tara:strand:+ start:11436 stop:12890 length:1455 start_codon:yes stop_codon:yes gene_type:complete
MINNKLSLKIKQEYKSMERNLKLVRLTILTLAVSFLGGCAMSSMFTPYPDQAESFKQAIYKGEVGTVVDRNAVLLELEEERESADHMLYMMERGRINQVGDAFNDSKKDFEQVIVSFEEQDLAATVQVGETAAQGASLITNDNAIPYKGSAYERIFVHHHQAFNYLGNKDLDGAAVEFRKVALEQRVLLEKHEKDVAEAYEKAEENSIDVDTLSDQFAGLDTIAGKVKSSFQNAYTFYASAAFWEATGELDSALIDYKKAFEINSDNDYIKQDIARVSKKRGDRIGTAETNEAQKGQGSIVLFFEEGFVPAKDQIKIPIPTLDGGFISLAFPYYQTETWPLSQQLRVMGNDFNELGMTRELVDVSALAVKDLKEQIPQLLVRQALRGFAKYQLQKQSGDQLGLAGQLAASLYNVVSESADRRSWLTLPHTVQVMRFNLDAGEQTLNLATTTSQAKINIPVSENRTIFVRVVGVNNQLIPQIFKL